MRLQYSFDVNEATEYGLQESIMIHNLRFWIIKNKANEKHSYEGKDGVMRTWTYNKTEALTKIFPFWSTDQINRLIKRMITKKILILGNFNQNAHDRTRWFAFYDEAKFITLDLVIAHSAKSPNGNGEIAEWKQRNHKMEIAKSQNGDCEIAKYITDKKPDKKPDLSLNLEEMQVFWKNLKKRENYFFEIDVKKFFEWCDDAEDLTNSWKNIMKSWVKKKENQILPKIDNSPGAAKKKQLEEERRKKLESSLKFCVTWYDRETNPKSIKDTIYEKYFQSAKIENETVYVRHKEAFQCEDILLEKAGLKMKLIKN